GCGRDRRRRAGARRAPRHRATLRLALPAGPSRAARLAAPAGSGHHPGGPAAAPRAAATGCRTAGKARGGSVRTRSRADRNPSRRSFTARAQYAKYALVAAVQPQELESPATLGDVLYAKPARAESEQAWVELVRAIAAGDQLALHALYERTHRLVFTLVMRITGNRETAEELTLDVFHDVWRRAGGYGAAK